MRSPSFAFACLFSRQYDICDGMNTPRSFSHPLVFLLARLTSSAPRRSCVGGCALPVAPLGLVFRPCPVAFASHSRPDVRSTVDCTTLAQQARQDTMDGIRLAAVCEPVLADTEAVTSDLGLSKCVLCAPLPAVVVSCPLAPVAEMPRATAVVGSGVSTYFRLSALEERRGPNGG